MFFKPSFKCFKNEKIIFSQVILKLESLFYIYTYIISSYFKFAKRFIKCNMGVALYNNRKRLFLKDGKRPISKRKL